MGNNFSTVRWESPTGGKFRIYSRFYDVYGLGSWKPVEVQHRIIGHPAFDRVGECLVLVELKPNGTQEIEFRKEKSWSAKQIRYLDCALDGLSAPYHWWGLVIIRPHLRLVKEAAQQAAIVKAKASEEATTAATSRPQETVIEKKEAKAEKKKITIVENKDDKVLKQVEEKTETKMHEKSEKMEGAASEIVTEQIAVPPAEGKKGKKKAKDAV
ncbi:uncharacterized protein IL334_003930 [Kwoniella shivajii]|uniref:Uncharacterized protein n=1 Tax=Kwoniella shivajii TaxID=564305 RepID=A0ABZ1D0P1_9TREE|nr:hypothetical protein IL334_003930 [Kwoniella shivajii]